MKNLNSMAVGLSLLIGIFAALPSLASDNSKAISATTDFGDGIKMSQYADQTGFEMTGGGGAVNYDARSKTMTMIDPNGVESTFCFDTDIATNAVQAVISQRQ
jgi:hypothetical protein